MMQKSLLADAHAALESYRKMESYRIQEWLLIQLISEYPTHENKSAVETKVKLLNLFYSTGIQAVNLMAENILSIKNIDDRLEKGDYKLVPQIAKLKVGTGEIRFNYSFATKYCAYHQPTKFPIYDSVVALTFASLFEKGFLPKYKYNRGKSNARNTYSKTEFMDKMKEYDFYVKVYNHFMEEYDLTSLCYREVDSYIWGAFKLPGDEFEIEKIAMLDKKNIKEYSFNSLK